MGVPSNSTSNMLANIMLSTAVEEKVPTWLVTGKFQETAREPSRSNPKLQDGQAATGKVVNNTTCSLTWMSPTGVFLVKVLMKLVNSLSEVRPTETLFPSPNNTGDNTLSSTKVTGKAPTSREPGRFQETALASSKCIWDNW